jgi:hypothetical protein
MGWGGGGVGGSTLKACKSHLDVGRNSLLVLGKYLLFIFFILKKMSFFLFVKT